MSEQYVSLAEVNELLDKENLRRGEMGIELNAIQKSAMDHAQKNARLSKENADALMNDLRELKFQTKDGEFVIPEYYVCKIADLLPKYMIKCKCSRMPLPFTVPGVLMVSS